MWIRWILIRIRIRNTGKCSLILVVIHRTAFPNCRPNNMTGWAPSCRGLCGGCGRLEPVSEFRSSRLGGGGRRLLCCKAKPVEKVFYFFIFVRDHTTVAEGEALTLVASGERCEAFGQCWGSVTFSADLDPRIRTSE
jgi:hypothetical protein